MHLDATDLAPHTDTDTQTLVIEWFTSGVLAGFALTLIGELLAVSVVTLFGVALAGLCLPLALLVMTWNLVRATGRYAGHADHVVEPTAGPRN